MLKRLSFLCVAMLALAACNSGDGNKVEPALTTPPVATAPSSVTTPAHASTVGVQPAASSDATASANVVDPASATTVTAARAAAPAMPFVDTGKWVEGKDYHLIQPAQPKVTGTDKIEVVEVFSYGCPACNQYHATANKLARELPANAQMAYLPASFVPQENWPMLQRAYYAALALGVAKKGNDAMYDAVWKTRELTAMKDSGGLKAKAALPTLEDAAKVYAPFGIDPKQFVAVANSFAVNTKVRRADELVKAYGVPGTPAIVINGKYRVSPSEVGGQESIDLTKWLVAKEAAGK